MTPEPTVLAGHDKTKSHYLKPKSSFKAATNLKTMSAIISHYSKIQNNRESEIARLQF